MRSADTELIVGDAFEVLPLLAGREFGQVVTGVELGFRQGPPISCGPPTALSLMQPRLLSAEEQSSVYWWWWDLGVGLAKCTREGADLAAVLSHTSGWLMVRGLAEAGWAPRGSIVVDYGALGVSTWGLFRKGVGDGPLADVWRSEGLTAAEMLCLGVGQPRAAETAGVLCRLLGFGEGDVLDPFAGLGTTLAAAGGLGRRSVGVELSEEVAGRALWFLRGGGHAVNERRVDVGKGGFKRLVDVGGVGGLTQEREDRDGANGAAAGDGGGQG